MRVKLRENGVKLWIIIPAENENLTWSGAEWVPVGRDGLSSDDSKIASFASARMLPRTLTDWGSMPNTVNAG